MDMSPAPSSSPESKPKRTRAAATKAAKMSAKAKKGKKGKKGTGEKEVWTGEKEVRNVNRELLRSHQRPRSCSRCLKGGRVCVRRPLSVSCEWCARHRNSCEEVSEHLWGEADHIAKQIKRLRANNDAGDDEAAVRLGRYFRKRIEARKRLEKKLYPGGETQREMAEMPRVMRRMAQAQLHSARLDVRLVDMSSDSEDEDEDEDDSE